MGLDVNSRLHRRALVTGGTDGIGKEIALGLAQRGLHLVIVGRNRDKGAQAEQDLRRATGNPNVDFVQADLSHMRELQRLANDVTARWASLHYLVHDAGVVMGRRELTADGIEANFAINYLSRFLLTRQLLPLLAAAGRPDMAARIVLVSGAAKHGKVYFDDVNLTMNFATLRAVLQFCRANDLFTVELAGRLSKDPAKPRVTVTCLKIGVVKTNIRREFPRWMKVLVPLLFDPFLAQTPQAAAQAALRLLLSEELEGVTGARFLKIGNLKHVSPTAGSLDPEERRRLWQLSEQMAAELVRTQ